MGCIPSKSSFRQEMAANGDVSGNRTKTFGQRGLSKNSHNLPASPAVEGGIPPPWITGHSKMTVEKDGNVTIT
ncbi:hypothetical protein VKT23_005502 [Stygiomarasmius scandens]|uniref:Uncharacterized protein n=1 Tax=Marasmiellus scandens TaxID=2682957 RepID=A0ABR1JSY7_9AGAR